MPDDTTILSLPLILPAQAQKHVTHNEALEMLDVIVQLAVISRTVSVPPALAVPGDRYIVPAGATADWAGQTGKVAVQTETGWKFHSPLPGWQAQVLTDAEGAVFDGLAWVAASQSTARFAQLGVGATPDATNRLSVTSTAVLLNHAGAGHQVKINKATPADTASLLFQTGFSGRAEMGTAGSDAFSIKVSADGTAFSTALTADPATGAVSLPSGAALASGSAAAPALAFSADPDTGLFRLGADEMGLAAGGVLRAALSAAAMTVNVPLTGTAVTQNAQDSTGGRLLKVGDHGLGQVAAVTYLTDIDNLSIPQGLWQTQDPATLGTFPAGQNKYGHLLSFRVGAAQIWQVYKSIVGRRLFHRSYATSAWSVWEEIYHAGSILGTVSQTGGAPTGRVVERGSNANGEYVRFADGTQICTRTNLSAANANTAVGSLFRSSANLAWTFPAAFIAAPALSGCTDDVDSWMIVAAAPTTTAVNLRAMAAITKASAIAMRATATGRWF